MPLPRFIFYSYFCFVFFFLSSYSIITTCIFTKEREHKGARVCSNKSKVYILSTVLYCQLFFIVFFSSVQFSSDQFSSILFCLLFLVLYYFVYIVSEKINTRTNYCCVVYVCIHNSCSYYVFFMLLIWSSHR